MDYETLVCIDDRPGDRTNEKLLTLHATYEPIVYSPSGRAVMVDGVYGSWCVKRFVPLWAFIEAQTELDLSEIEREIIEQEQWEEVKHG